MYNIFYISIIINIKSCEPKLKQKGEYFKYIESIFVFPSHGQCNWKIIHFHRLIQIVILIRNEQNNRSCIARCRLRLNNYIHLHAYVFISVNIFDIKISDVAQLHKVLCFEMTNKIICLCTAPIFYGKCIYLTSWWNSKKDSWFLYLTFSHFFLLDDVYHVLCVYCHVVAIRSRQFLDGLRRWPNHSGLILPSYVFFFKMKFTMCCAYIATWSPYPDGPRKRPNHSGIILPSHFSSFQMTFTMW